MNSLHNTLDDGNGNVLINGTSVTPLLIFNPTMMDTYSTMMIGVANSEYNSGFLQFYTSATGSSTNFIRIGVTDAPAALTINGVGNVSTNSGTVLDDGSGNLIVKGNQTIINNLTVDGGTFTLNNSDETFSIVTTEAGANLENHTRRFQCATSRCVPIGHCEPCFQSFLVQCDVGDICWFTTIK